ncbi:HU family DNA-binding protein [Yoonia sp.]|uniref:HU family DNA-binding protein n=1 Tax=Yoonia sp. TaxID=2212373 RepID=UPI0039752686
MQRTSTQTEPVTADEPRLIKKPELLEEVVARTGLKKRDVKPAVEAALAVLGDALREGAEVNMPPLGKLRVVKTKALDGGALVMTLKLRTPNNATHAIVIADDA